MQSILVRRVLLAITLLVLALVPLTANAADPRVPAPLEPWVPWVLHGKEEALCPVIQGGSAQCVWPTRVDLELGDRGGTFVQGFRVDAKRMVPLPGDARRWPQGVKVDGKDAVVLAQGGRPMVELPPGNHELKGRFEWDSLPESIAVPGETGLVALTVRGKRIELPQRDKDGNVWLQKTAEAQEGDALEIVVHRRVEDDVPTMLTTRIQLAVSGKAREIVLGRVLPADFTVVALESQLPARVEPDSRLRVQARAGTYVIEVTARSEKAMDALVRPNPQGPWREGEEVWVFAARPELRVVDVEGVSSIDPQQTSLPDAWRKLPAFPMKVGDTMRFTTRRRGDADPPPDRLSLARTVWLDFDGKGMTFEDWVTGTMSRSTRLEMLAPMSLGRVAIRGKDQLVTKLATSPGTGVELRQGDLSVYADGRYVGDVGSMPAIGWDHDFVSARTTLHVPPGFRLLHASGVDEVPGTWLRHWTLLEIFLVLVLTAAVMKLYGPIWAGVAAVAMVLAFPENEAPRWVWAVVLSIEALWRVLPDGIPRKLASVLRLATLVVLAAIVVPFVVHTVRVGLYPSLEQSVDMGGMKRMPPASDGDALKLPTPAPESPAAAASEPFRSADKEVDDKPAQKQDAGKMARKAPAGGLTSSSYGLRSQQAQLNIDVYDPNAMVQTGPGLPSWTWNTLPLKWSGPVERTQRLRLYLLGPIENLVLALVRALAIFALALRMLPFFDRIIGKRPGGGGAAKLAAAAIVLAAVSLAPGHATAAEVPPADILEELQKRLLAPPTCLPDCVSMPRMALDVRGQTLRARIAIDAGARVAVALPGSPNQWLPERVEVDGKVATGLLVRDGKLYIALDPGSHDVIIEGRLPDRDTVQLALPTRPQRVEAQTSGWKLDGVHEDGLADDSLQLTRVRTETGPAGSLEASTLPPFVRVERTLRIGLAWTVETRVVRASQAGGAVVLEIPTLAGESVTTPDVRASGGKVQVNLAATATEMTWKSVLDSKSPITLVAPKGVPWVETFRLDLSPIWHATFDGIPPVHPGAARGAQMPEWRPWPGETVSIAISRPDGVAGQTLTIDQSTLDVRPGIRSTDTKLTLSLRSSRGGQHVLTLPEGAILESLKIGNTPQPVRQEGRKVALPVSPGAATVELAWRAPTGITSNFQVAPTDVGIDNVNAKVSVVMSDARWVLFVGGPRLGPAVLFWGMLVVLLAVAIALGRVRTTPLGVASWLLLGVGLSQLHVVFAIIVVGWLLALGYRRKHPEISHEWFDLRQLVLAAWTVLALGLLIAGVHHGLLGEPDMQITGNDSSGGMLYWYRDRGPSTLPEPSIVSLPILVYRLAMLAWALWLAISLVRWLRWGWESFSTGGLWRSAPGRSKPAKSPADAPREPPPAPPPAEPPPGDPAG